MRKLDLEKEWPSAKFTDKKRLQYWIRRLLDYCNVGSWKIHFTPKIYLRIGIFLKGVWQLWNMQSHTLNIVFSIFLVVCVMKLSSVYIFAGLERYCVVKVDFWAYVRLLSIVAIVLVWSCDFEHMRICFGVYELVLKRHCAVVWIVLEKSV